VIIEVVFDLAAAKFIHLFCGNNFKHIVLLSLLSLQRNEQLCLNGRHQLKCFSIHEN
jgi:hypothetical protein